MDEDDSSAESDSADEQKNPGADGATRKHEKQSKAKAISTKTAVLCGHTELIQKYITHLLSDSAEGKGLKRKLSHPPFQSGLYCLARVRGMDRQMVFIVWNPEPVASGITEQLLVQAADFSSHFIVFLSHSDVCILHDNLQEQEREAAKPIQKKRLFPRPVQGLPLNTLRDAFENFPSMGRPNVSNEGCPRELKLCCVIATSQEYFNRLKRTSAVERVTESFFPGPGSQWAVDRIHLPEVTVEHCIRFNGIGSHTTADSTPEYDPLATCPMHATLKTDPDWFTSAVLTLPAVMIASQLQPHNDQPKYAIEIFPNRVDLPSSKAESHSTHQSTEQDSARLRSRSMEENSPGSPTSNPTSAETAENEAGGYACGHLLSMLEDLFPDIYTGLLENELRDWQGIIQVFTCASTESHDALKTLNNIASLTMRLPSNLGPHQASNVASANATNASSRFRHIPEWFTRSSSNTPPRRGGGPVTDDMYTGATGTGNVDSSKWPAPRVIVACRKTNNCLFIMLSFQDLPLAKMSELPIPLQDCCSMLLFATIAISNVFILKIADKKRSVNDVLGGFKKVTQRHKLERRSNPAITSAEDDLLFNGHLFICTEEQVKKSQRFVEGNKPFFDGLFRSGTQAVYAKDLIVPTMRLVYKLRYSCRLGVDQDPRKCLIYTCSGLTFRNLLKMVLDMVQRKDASMTSFTELVKKQIPKIADDFEELIVRGSKALIEETDDQVSRSGSHAVALISPSTVVKSWKHQQEGSIESTVEESRKTAVKFLKSSDDSTLPCCRFDHTVAVGMVSQEDVPWTATNLMATQRSRLQEIAAKLYKEGDSPECIAEKVEIVHRIMVNVRAQQMESYLKSQVYKSTAPEFLKIYFNRRIEKLKSETLCKDRCGDNCYYLCLLPKGHAEADHDCCLSIFKDKRQHSCPDQCQMPKCKAERRPCTLPAGHQFESKEGCEEPELHQCKHSENHQCDEDCAYSKAKDCKGRCIKLDGHATRQGKGNNGQHICCKDAAQHNCDQICQLCKAIANSAALRTPDEVRSHKGLSLCCGKVGKNHPHHLCGKEHQCPVPCPHPGRCPSTVSQHGVENTAAGQKAMCSETIARDRTEHDEQPHGCGADETNHLCEYRCKLCDNECTRKVKHEGRCAFQHQVIPLNRLQEVHIENKFGEKVEVDVNADHTCDSLCKIAGPSHAHWLTRGKLSTSDQQDGWENRPDNMIAWSHEAYFRDYLGCEDPFEHEEDYNRCTHECPYLSHADCDHAPQCTETLFHRRLKPEEVQSDHGGYVTTAADFPKKEGHKAGHHFPCKNHCRGECKACKDTFLGFDRHWHKRKCREGVKGHASPTECTCHGHCAHKCVLCKRKCALQGEHTGHFCEQSHVCPKPCQSPGRCKQENDERLSCKIRISQCQAEHPTTDRCTCNAEIHWCKERCSLCINFCDLPVNHCVQVPGKTQRTSHKCKEHLHTDHSLASTD